METAFVPVEVFFSFAEADALLLGQLERHLSVLRHEGYISTWHKRQIVAGSNWQVELDHHLNTAALILLLISPDFLASDYQYGVELQRAMQRHEDNEARVIPVLLRACDWESAPFHKLQGVPHGGKSVTSWRNRDEAFAQIAKEIRVALKTMLQLTISSPPSTFPKIWQVPSQRNPFFTGRDQELDRLHTQLQQGTTAVVGQMQSVSGLGGIGKTQLVIEYAYRYQDEYQHILWARAESVEALSSSFTEIAHMLNLPEKDAQEQAIMVQAVKRWLQRQRGWLLILDNADNLALLSDFLPPTVGGHLLITTRAAEVHAHLSGLAHPLVVDTFSDEQGALFLLRRSGLLALDATADQAATQTQQLAREIANELGGLPLALDQAGAYLKATGCSLVIYQQIYRQHRAHLLKERRSADHPEPVARTWALSFQRIKQQNPAAAELLELCAFLAPAAIPEEFLMSGATYLSPTLEAVMADPFLLDQTVEILRGYSLLNRDPQNRTLSMHRLVQAVLRDEMEEAATQQWIERVIQIVVRALPKLEFSYFPAWEHLLKQVQMCAELIQQHSLRGTEAVTLLDQTAAYLMGRLRYREAEPLFEQVLQMQKQQWGVDHPLIATCLINLAHLYREQGKYEQAELFYQRALALQEKQFGGEDLQITLILDELALFYEGWGKYDQAENLYIRAFTIREKRLGTLHLDTVLSLRRYANLLAFLGEDVLADNLDKRIIATCNQYVKTKRPLAVTDLEVLAELYSGYGMDERVKDMYTRALTLQEKQLGAEHPDIIRNLIILARIHEKSSRGYEQAKLLYQRALAIYEQQFGVEDYRTAVPITNLAIFYQNQERYELAEPLFQRALAIYEQQLGAEDPLIAGCIFNLACIYSDQKKYELAESLYQRALAIYELQINADYFTARCLKNLADIYSEQKKYELAEPLYQRSLAICKQEPGSAHSLMLRIYERLEALLRAMGRSEEAKKLQEDARRYMH